MYYLVHIYEKAEITEIPVTQNIYLEKFQQHKYKLDTTQRARSKWPEGIALEDEL